MKLGELGRILDIWDGDAIVMSQRLANELGIAVGISSGANLLGALEIAHEQGDGACVATVFCDDNKKYLSTDLCSDEEMQGALPLQRGRAAGLPGDSARACGWHPA